MRAACPTCLILYLITLLLSGKKCHHKLRSCLLRNFLQSTVTSFFRYFLSFVCVHRNSVLKVTYLLNGNFSCERCVWGNYNAKDDHDIVIAWFLYRVLWIVIQPAGDRKYLRWLTKCRLSRSERNSEVNRPDVYVIFYIKNLFIHICWHIFLLHDEEKWNICFTYHKHY